MRILQYGPPIFQEYVQGAVIAVLAGAEPTVGAEEWTACWVTFLPKIPSAMSIKDYRPVTNLCSKLIIKHLICNCGLNKLSKNTNLWTTSMKASVGTAAPNGNLPKYMAS